MTQQYQFTTADYTSYGAAGNRELSTAPQKGLDSMHHLSNTVPAISGAPISQTITQEELQLMNIDQVCDALNMGRWKVYDLISSKKLSTVKIGTRRLVRVSALRDFIQQLEINDG